MTTPGTHTRTRPTWGETDLRSNPNLALTLALSLTLTLSLSLTLSLALALTIALGPRLA